MTVIDTPHQVSGQRVRAAAHQTLVAGLFLVAAATALTAVALSATAVSDQILWSAIAVAVFCTGLLLLMAATGGYHGIAKVG